MPNNRENTQENAFAGVGGISGWANRYEDEINETSSNLTPESDDRYAYTKNSKELSPSSNTDQNLYIINTSGHDGVIEAYTSDEINVMKQIIASRDGVSAEDMDNYTNGSNNYPISMNEEGAYNGENAGVIGKDVEIDGSTASYTNWNGNKANVHFTNGFASGLDSDNPKMDGWTNEEYHHMEDIIAIADAADGKGASYEDNLNSLHEMSPEAAIYEKTEQKETETEDSAENEIESETTPQNVYRVKINHYDNRQEAYTSDDIDKMKDMLAEHDGMSREEFDNYTNGIEKEAADGMSLEYDGLSNGEKAGILGETAEYDGKTLSYTSRHGQDANLEITNDFDMNDISAENMPQEAWDKMAQIVAVADACDGNGNYEDNINQLKIYDYSHQKEMQDNEYSTTLEDEVGEDVTAYEESGFSDEYDDENTQKNTEDKNTDKASNEQHDSLSEKLDNTEKENEQLKGIRKIKGIPGIRGIMAGEALAETVENVADNEFEDNDREAGQ